MAVNKVEFCRRFILPKTRVVPKYIGLYRRLLKSEKGVLAFKKMEKRAAPVTSSSSSSSTTVSPSRSPESDNSVNKCSDSDEGKAETKESEKQGEGDESEIEDF